jgi:hypothetical protein
MKNTLNYETILGFKSLEMNDISNKSSEKLDVVSVFNNLLSDQNPPDLNSNIEIEYKIKGKSKTSKLIVPKNNNYSGASLKLPASTSKATLKTTIKQGQYTNTWLILQNRNVYIPKLEVNGKKLLPTSVNGAYIRFSFDTILSNIENNEVKITTTFNTGSNNNTIVGIWFDW